MRAIERGDVARLTAIPGVGKKTVGADRARAEGSPAARAAGARPSAIGGADAPALRDDVLSALMNLGYHRPLAEKAVDAARQGRRPTAASSERSSRRCGTGDDASRSHRRATRRHPRMRRPPRARRRRRAVRGGAAAARARRVHRAGPRSREPAGRRSPRRGSAAKRSITCCSTARPASARRRSPTSSATRWACRCARPRARRSRSPAISSASSPTWPPREVLFIDEIHRMSPAIEEILYPAMEDYELDIVIGQGPSARIGEGAARSGSR